MFTVLQNISVSNKCCSFELSIYQRILKKRSWFSQKYQAADFNVY